MGLYSLGSWLKRSSIARLHMSLAVTISLFLSTNVAPINSNAAIRSSLDTVSKLIKCSTIGRWPEHYIIVLLLFWFKYLSEIIIIIIFNFTCYTGR